MAEVVFLTRGQRYGAKTVTGPVTGIPYTITPHGTPVSEYDASALLEMVEVPCCGPGPFEGMIRSFGVTVPTIEQLKAVPQHLWDASPPVVEKKPSRVEKLYDEKKYDKPAEEEVVAEEEIVVEEVIETEKEEEIEEVD